MEELHENEGQKTKPSYAAITALMKLSVAGVLALCQPEDIPKPKPPSKEQIKEPEMLWEVKADEIKLGQTTLIEVEDSKKKKKLIPLRFSEDGKTFYVNGRTVKLKTYGVNITVGRVYFRKVNKETFLIVEGDTLLGGGNSTYTKKTLKNTCELLLKGENVMFTIHSGSGEVNGVMIPEKIE